MCGYIVFPIKIIYLEHFAVSKWNLTAEELKQLLLVSKVTLNAPVIAHDQYEEPTHETSTRTNPHRNETPVESCEHDQASTAKPLDRDA
jgi:hypothetical protein